ncbi:MAG: hypothetical protein HQM08_14470 [Candidatus Riflebacteria bacterium]|nr:hypothetical protein [Candidatus Riflebacteria bacterium]
MHKVSEKGTNRSGSLLLLVLGIILILGIFGGALYHSLTEKARFITMHANSMLFDFVAMEIASVFFNDLSEKLKDPNNPIFLEVLKASQNSFPVTIKIDKDELSRKFSFIGKKEFSSMSFSWDAYFVDPKPILNGDPWNDPWEKLCEINLNIDLSTGKLPLKLLRKSFKFSKPCKIQQLSPPVLSKFTLFIKNPELTDEKNEGYNCFENTIDGKSTQTAKNLPIVLSNSSDIKQTDLKKVGFVFLGGNQETQLHVTSGGDPEYGEFFQLLNIQKPEVKAPVFKYKDLPTSFSKTVKLSDSPLVQAKLEVQGILFGFYLVDNSNPVPQDMNYKRTLGKYFTSSGQNSRTKKSSVLHLIGNLKNPSPTKVIGKVKRVFPQYSALMADVDNDGKNDGVLAMMNTPPDYVTPSGGTIDFWESVVQPKTFKNKNTNQEISLSSFSVENLFGSKDQYMSFSSKLIMEDYNTSYNFLMDSSMEMPPKDFFKAVTGENYQISGEKVKIAHESDGRVFFNSDLNSLSTKIILSDRISMTAENQDEFFKECMENNSLNLRGQTVFIKKGPLTLPAGLEIETAGILAVKGDITVSGKISKKGEATLSLISVGGNILLKGVNEKVQAYLVALDGTVKNLTNTPLQIEGGIAVDRLPPESFANGGTLIYDCAFDPTRLQQEKSYSVQIGDYFDKWNFENK